MITDKLKVGREYRLPNETLAVYLGVERLNEESGECLKFISRTPAPTWFWFDYVVVDDSRLNGRKIISEKGVVYSEAREMPQLEEAIFNQQMRKHYQRIFRGNPNVQKVGAEA